MPAQEIELGGVVLVNVPRAAALLGVSASRVLRSIRSGELVAVTHGGRLLLALDEVDRFAQVRRPAAPLGVSA